jgi:hypothetical protein
VELLLALEEASKSAALELGSSSGLSRVVEVVMASITFLNIFLQFK